MWYDDPTLLPTVRRIAWTTTVATFVLCLMSIFVLVGVGLFSAARPSVATTPTLTNSTVVDAGTGYPIDVATAVDAQVAFASATVVPQWRTFSTPVTTDLMAIGCANASTCIAPGLNDGVVKTTNGGTTWTQLNSGTSGVNFEAVAYVDTNTAWLVGDVFDSETFSLNYRILKTTNGGTTWTTQATGSSGVGLYGISCVDTSTCFAPGDAGTILRTTNGGTTWTTQATGSIQQLRDIVCLDASTCYTAGYGATVMKTTNGGTSWTSVGPGTGTFESIACTDANTCYAAGASGRIAKTTNGGTSWTTQTSGTTEGIERISCPVTDTCWAATGNFSSPKYVVLATTNGGTTWTTDASSATLSLWGMTAVDAHTAYIVGDDGAHARFSRNARLQTNAGNAQVGAPTGASLCASVALGSDGNGNANRRIICSHANLSASTWYTFTVTTGVTDTGGDALATTFTRTFATGAIGAPPVTMNGVSLQPPSMVTGIFVNGVVQITWSDPVSAPTDRVRILLIDGDRASVRGVVPFAAGTFTDPVADLLPGVTYVFGVQREDGLGNRSASTLLSVLIPGPSVAPTSSPSNTPPAAPPEPLLSASPGSPSSLPMTIPAGDAATVPIDDALLGLPVESVPPTVLGASIALPCTLSVPLRAHLLYAFVLTQGRNPSTVTDLGFVCHLLIDPLDPEDPTVLFPTYRNLAAEVLALKNFVNFFQRPPSLDTRNRPLATATAANDWWAVKYMAYHLRIKPTVRDVESERACTRLFVHRDVDLYKNGTKTRKLNGLAPEDIWDFDFIRACAYSGAGFLSK